MSSAWHIAGDECPRARSMPFAGRGRPPQRVARRATCRRRGPRPGCRGRPGQLASQPAPHRRDQVAGLVVGAASAPGLAEAVHEYLKVHLAATRDMLRARRATGRCSNACWADSTRASKMRTPMMAGIGLHLAAWVPQMNSGNDLVRRSGAVRSTARPPGSAALDPTAPAPSSVTEGKRPYARTLLPRQGRFVAALGASVSMMSAQWRAPGQVGLRWADRPPAAEPAHLGPAEPGSRAGCPRRRR